MADPPAPPPMLDAAERSVVLWTTLVASSLGVLACVTALAMALSQRRQSRKQRDAPASTALHVWAMKTLCDAVVCADHLWLAAAALARPHQRFNGVLLSAPSTVGEPPTAWVYSRNGSTLAYGAGPLGANTAPLGSRLGIPGPGFTSGSSSVFDSGSGLQGFLASASNASVQPGGFLFGSVAELDVAAVCMVHAVVLELALHASSVWLLLLSVDLWSASRDPFARGGARLPLFHAAAWGFGILACVGLSLSNVWENQPNSACWLDTQAERSVGGVQLVFELFPISQLLAVVVSLVVLLRVGLILKQNTSQVLPYRRRILTRGLLFVGAYGALGLLKLAICIVMVGLHHHRSKSPTALQAFALSESVLLLALALVDAVLVPFFLVTLRGGRAPRGKGIWFWLRTVRREGAGSRTESQQSLLLSKEIHRSNGAEDAAVDSDSVLDCRGSLQDGPGNWEPLPAANPTTLTDPEDVLSLRALRSDVMLCTLFGIMSTLNQRSTARYTRRPRAADRRWTASASGEDEGSSSRDTAGGDYRDTEGNARFLYNSGASSRGLFDATDDVMDASGTLSSAFLQRSGTGSYGAVQGLPLATHRVRQQARQRVMLPPVYNRELDFIDYERDAFARLRALHNLSPQEYAHSLWGDSMDQQVRQMTEQFASGRSGSFFYLTHDRRFLVKTMTSKEREILLDILPDYEVHLQAHPASVLCRVCGMHSVRLSKEQRFITIMVQVNVLAPGDALAPVSVAFDLKGSTVDRQALAPGLATVEQLEAMAHSDAPRPHRTLKDMDLLGPLVIGNEAKAALQVQLVADTTFLHTHDIMDYSLLVGIHRCTPTCAGTHAQPLARDVPQDGTAPRRVRYSQQLRHGLAGVWHEQPVVIFVGIIDMLQRFDAVKRAERALKTRCYRKRRNEISAAHPDYYAERFVQANMAKFQ